MTWYDDIDFNIDAEIGLVCDDMRPLSEHMLSFHEVRFVSATLIQQYI